MSYFKRTILTLFLFCFASVSFFAVSAKPAKAQLIVANPTQDSMSILDRVTRQIGVTLMQTGTLALVNAMNYFTQKLAYDAAVWVAAGGGGQKPLFDGKSVGDYFKDTALNAAGDFIGTLSEGTLGKLGFNLCAPTMPTLFVKIKLGLAANIPGGMPAPKCEWNQIYSNWDTFVSTASTGELLKNVGFMFEGGQSELGVAFELNSLAIVKQETASQNAIIERLSNKGWKDVTDIVTGKIKTPADVVKGTFDTYNKDKPLQNQNLSDQVYVDALQKGAYQILPAALSTFTNTLLSTLLNKVMVGLFPGDLFADDNGNLLTDANQSATPASPAVGRRKAQEIYSDLIKPKITVSSNYDPLIEFTACPGDVEKSINNCVLDDGFASAVRLASQGGPITILEAIKQGYLDGSKPLISSNDSRNQKTDCYSTGYCYSNLVKLRKARIVPVGFELAAEAGADQSNPPTLSDVIAGFNNCTSDGERDRAHPYCHLLDPNWVLRLPKTQCQAQVYGQTLLSTAGPMRAEECADPISCIAEDGNGNCIGGWGYCTKEKNIWRISADVCDEQFNSCLTYKPRTSEQKSDSYLKNTLDFAMCTAFNAGCRPYSVNQIYGNWDLSPDNAIYFNKNLEKCDVKSAGCTEVYDKTNGLAYNLISGSSFEGEDFKQYWNILTGASALLVSDAFNNSSVAVLVSDSSQGIKGISPNQPIRLENNTAYAISVYAKQSKAGGTSEAAIGFSLFTDSAATKIFDASNIIITCNGNIPAEQAFVEGTAQIFQSSISGDSFSRISCAFLTPAMPLYAKIYLGTVKKGEILFDAIQLEEGASATAYLFSGYGSVIAKNIKIAPEYLNCDVDSGDPACTGYAGVCKEEELGCELYTPKTGEPAVPGVASINDVCPATCVGYETYRQEKASFEEEKFPLYFIPTTAAVCNANDTGCDEFTDIETESLEYFSFIRMCKKPGEADNTVFYTWEGSDTAGYQLRSHRLVTGGALPGEVGPVPAYIEGTDSALCGKAIFETEITDPGYNPDCREFYNQNGQISYRLLSKTIIATDDCKNYRKTESIEPDCVLSGGIWQGQAGFCLYKGYKAESVSCGAAAAGCRAYSGSAASNMRLVLQDDFEGGSASGFVPGTLSPEALNAGGHSLKVLPVIGQAQTEKNVSSLLGANGIYTLSFWAKAPGGGNMEIGIMNASEDFFSISALKSEWQYYEVGPIRAGAQIPATSALHFALTGGNGFYIDNIVLQEASQKTYLVKNSWNTPAECDATINGLGLPQAMLGCKEYSDKSNNSVYLKSFSSLCREKAVGCKSFIDTYNSGSDKNEIYNAICSRDDFDGGDCQYNGVNVCQVSKGHATCRFKIMDGLVPTLVIQQKNFNKFNDVEVYLINQAVSAGVPYIAARDESTVEVNADKTIYIIDDSSKYCNQKDLGCAEMGMPGLYGASLQYGANPQTVYIAETASGATIGGQLLDSATYNPAQQYVLLTPLGAGTVGKWEFVLNPSKNIVGEFEFWTGLGSGADAVYFYFFNTTPATGEEASAGGYIVAYDEYNNNTVQLSYNGELLEQYFANDIDNSIWRSAKVVLDSNNKNIKVYLDGALIINYTDIARSLAGTHFGLGARTGGLNNEHRVRNFSVYEYTSQVTDAVAATSQTVYYKNLPDTYDSVLCTAEAEGCESWTSDKGVDYFKVPASLCEYKGQGAVSSAGWYKRGTSEPCYSGFITNNTYGIWRNADKDYIGSVGLCPSSQNGCTEIIDPLDTSSANPNGQPYYLIDNEKLQDLENDPDCSGNVSLEEGCVLFNKTSDTTLKWFTQVSYDKAAQAKKLVPPVAEYAFCGINPIFGWGHDPFKICSVDTNCPGAGTTATVPIFGIPVTITYTGSCFHFPPNANTILKVTRDRECGEWLACKTTIKATDPITNKEKPVCVELGLCNKYSASSGNASCANFLTTNDDSGWILDADYYTRRDTGWYAMDYSGYSVGNQFPVTDIKTQDIGTTEKEFILYANKKKTIGTVLGVSTIITTSGQYDLDGSTLVKSAAEGTICRGYPEQDSPFPASVAEYDINGNLLQVRGQAFQNANICEYGEDCFCDYTKVTYGNATTKKYISYGNRNVASGICQGGLKDGQPCTPGVKYEDDPKNSCGDYTGGGTCLALKRQDDVIGWQGYCIEEDLSTPINGDKTQKACLTWLPQDLVPGARDIYNQFRTAGYVPPLGAGKYYCLQASGNYDINSRNPKNYYDNFANLSPAISTKCFNGQGVYFPSRICGTDETFSGFGAFASNAWLGAKSVSIVMSDQDTTNFGLKQSFNTSFTNQPINKDQIDLIRIKVLDQERLDMDVGTIFYVRSDQETTNYMAGTGYCDGIKKTDNCMGEENNGGLKGQEKALSLSSGDNWYFRYDDNEEVDGTKRDYLAVDLFTLPDVGNDDIEDIDDFCGNGDEVAQDAYALKFRFINNILQGIDVAGCTSGAQGGKDQLHGAIFEISFRMKELCEVVVDVASNNNMANTNILWQYNPDNKKGAEQYPTNFMPSSPANILVPYHYNYEMQPFGSAASDISPGKTENWYSNYTVNTYKFAGVPWSCKGNCGTPQPSNDDITDIDFKVDNSSLFTAISGKPNILDETVGGSALNYISNIFGKVFKVFKWNTKTGYTEIDCGLSPSEPACQLDQSETGQIPMIYSYTPSLKLDNNQYPVNTFNRIVINNITSGDINVKDGQYLAIMRFYFWADTNQMPIKSIQVDWEGEGKFDVETTDGMYKNHKPRCATSNTEEASVCSGPGGSGIVCKSDSDCPGSSTCTGSLLTFGNSPDACDEAYFEIQHTYTCNQNSSSYYPSTGKCEFNPEIVIVDNWKNDNRFDSTSNPAKTILLPNGTTRKQTGAYYEGKIILQPAID
ncbi:hypothetical protein L6259_02375 [Candidatus Parcubacteria bacterium]|nr:hypothetical protein [Candidatus Parcubacteria bacterium]